MPHASRRPVSRAVLLAFGALAALAAVIAVLLPGPAAHAASAGKGTVITTVPGPLGPMLIVGSGKYQGYTLYMMTSDTPPTYACTTAKFNLGGGPGLACTGPPGSQSAEWPALPTSGAPVAGPGGKASLLGSVERAKIGDQVTYAGHPLYLFDQQAGQITGEDWVEPGLPPWHGVWYLLSPAGTPLAWPGMLVEKTVNGKNVLASLIYTLAGVKADPVYSFSSDTSSKSACSGACAIAWPPLLTDGTPGVASPVSASHLGTLHRPDGTDQVTYDGKPLYLFSRESGAKIPAQDGLVFLGSGNGVAVSGGTFRFVTP